MHMTFIENGQAMATDGSVRESLAVVQDSTKRGCNVRVCRLQVSPAELKQLAALDVLDEFKDSTIHSSTQEDLMMNVSELQHAGGGHLRGAHKEESLEVPDVFNFSGAAGTANKSSDGIIESNPDGLPVMPSIDWSSCGEPVANERTTGGTRSGGEKCLEAPRFFG